VDDHKIGPKRIANSGYFQKSQREVIGFHERTSNELMDS
jgi:hypothetical protein